MDDIHVSINVRPKLEAMLPIILIVAVVIIVVIVIVIVKRK